MTLDYLKKEHPDIYAEAIFEGMHLERGRIVNLLVYQADHSNDAQIVNSVNKSITYGTTFKSIKSIKSRLEADRRRAKKKD